MDLTLCSLFCKQYEVYYLSLSTNSKGEHFMVNTVVLCTNTFVAPVTSIKLIIKALYVSEVSYL